MTPMDGDRKDDSTGFFTRHVLYPDHYAWFVLASAMDLLMTGIVLYRGGAEMNRLAEFVILHFGRGGIVAFKFALVAVILVICEIVGQRRRDLGRRLATWAGDRRDSGVPSTPAGRWVTVRRWPPARGNVRA